MNKRQKEVQQAFLDDEKKVLKKLEKNYQDALDEINSKIELLMARQDADMQHVIYQVEYQRALKTQVQSILETLQANEFETVSEYLANSYHDGFIGTMYDLQGQGIPLIFPIDQEAVVAAVQQDTKLSEPLYTAMGKDITDLKKKITGEISRGLSSGQMYGEISRNIASWANIPKNNAMRIARTEAHRIQCKATADAQFRAKEKGADVVKQWDASLDAKTRDSHVKVDGEIRELDEKFSNGLRYPGDPSGGAEEVINCRCALLQRARWALGNDYTKWSADAPIVIDDEGTTQFAIIEAKNYEDFQKKYKQASERVREGAQKMNKGFVPAKSIEEAEEYATKILGIPKADYSGAEMAVVNAMNEAFTNGINYCPKIKDRLNFVGVTQNRNKYVLEELETYYRKRLEEIKPDLNPRWYETESKNLSKALVQKIAPNNWAYAFNGRTSAKEEGAKKIIEKYAGITVNGRVAKNADEFLGDIIYNVEDGYHPLGTGSIKALFDHEVGHQIGYAFDLENDSEMIALWKKYTGKAIETGLSRYGKKNIDEFIAEGYSEYLNSPEPREISKNIFEIIDKKVKDAK